MVASDLTPALASNPFFESLCPLLLQLKKRFDERRETLAFAESCTGGLLSAALTSLPGVSSFYLGAVVSYHHSVKDKILRVPMSTIQVLGEVSIPVALDMARGAKEALGSTWAVSITGVAGPSGGTKEKPVGTVCFGFLGPGVTENATKYFSPSTEPPQSRESIQQKSVAFALQYLLNL